MRNTELPACKYHKQVHCQLAPEAPYCHMQCVFNEDAKEHIKQMTKTVNEKGVGL